MIQIFITGGTFDKEYNLITGELFFKDTHLPQMLDRGRCTLDVDIKTLMMVDSLEMTEEDREIIIHNCRKSPANEIIITHGTDRMVNTGQALVGIPDKCIVLTGAMEPAHYKSSDAVFNVGVAVGAISALPDGVYIAMNGRVFDPFKCRKNRDLGVFEEIQ